MPRKDGNSHVQGMSRVSVAKALKAQREWIEKCGVDLAGYIRTYGSVSDPAHYGDGAEAIYKADTDYLESLSRRWRQGFGPHSPTANTLPSLGLGGSAARHVAENASEAIETLQKAHRALVECYPHGRDYIGRDADMRAAEAELDHFLASILLAKDWASDLLNHALNVAHAQATANPADLLHRLASK